METGTAESAKVLNQQQKKKLVVRFADTLEPFTIKVKPNMKKGKPLIIFVKSSKLVNLASAVNQSDQKIPWSDLLMTLDAKGQLPQDRSGIRYHESMRSDLYSSAAQRNFRLMMGDAENRQIYPAVMASSHNWGSRQETNFRQLENETRSSAQRDTLRRSLGLIRVLEAYN